MADQTILTGMGSAVLRTPELTDYLKYKDELALLHQNGKKNIQILELNSIKHPPDAITEMYDGFTATLDGTAGAVHLDVIGADAKDTAAGVGAQAVTIIGINDANLLVAVSIEMGGAATVHAPTYLWKRLITAYISRVGSEGNAAALIQIVIHAGTVEGTILMGSDACVTHRVYVPTGKTAFMKLRCVEKPVAAAAVTIVSRAMVYPWSSVTGVRTAVNPIVPNPQGEVVSADAGANSLEYIPRIAPVVGDNSSFLTVYTNTLNTAATGPELIVQQTVFLYDT
jgi:hypothetical protein